MQVHTIILTGGIVFVYDFLESRFTSDNLATLERYLQRMPPTHQHVIYPIFVMERKPGGGENGGTWRPNIVQSSFAGRERVTGVPETEVRRIVPDGEGLIGIPRNRWEGRTPMSTVFHEIAHSVDIELSLTPSWLRPAHLAGVLPICGGSPVIVKYAVEAYARWIVTPSQVCRAVPHGESQAEADNRVFAALAETPAFRMVPPTWDPSGRRRNGRWPGTERPEAAILAGG